ncbi:MAG: hypothetical protein QOG04_1465 [Actinomycetota bacterium]|jgi:DNA-binding NarL/FixJ family response regulator|nr:hypothetical protein [Actinomycetota bacterium]
MMSFARSRVATVLVVDDQSMIRTVLRRILEKTGLYAVAEAESASQAVDVIRHSAPDAMILDISMPGQAGLTVIAALRRMSSSTKILVLSGHDGMGDEVLRLGADAFLPKTAPSHVVLKTIASLLDGGRPEHKGVMT